MNFKIAMRYWFSFFVYPISFIVSGLIINLLQCILHFGLKPYNKQLFRKINYYLCYTLYCHMIFLVDWYSGSEIFVYMDKNDLKNYFGKEHAYVIANHKYEVDWLLIGAMSEKFHCMGNFKAYMKKAIQYMPSVGWCLFFSENVFLERSFDKDKQIIEKQISELVNYPDPMWLILYPEGTRYTPAKYESSIKFAKEKGLPELKHHLVPRSKGFLTSLPPMKGKMGAVYDVTLSFKPTDKNAPTIVNLFYGQPIEAHFYVKRIPFEEVPENEEMATKFLQNIFNRKDKLQESFFKTGDYFTESGVERVDKIKLKPNILTFVNCVTWYIAITIPTLYYIIKVLLTANIYTLSVVMGTLFLFLYLFYKGLGMSQTKKGSSYGIQKQK